MAKRRLFAPIARQDVWLLLFLTVVALILRLYNLGYHSLWIDETIHSNIALQTVDQHKPFWNIENNQIFIHLLNVIAYFLFGASDFVFRLPVAVLSVLGIWSTYLLARRLINRQVALIAALFWVGSLFFLAWGRIDRAYGIIPMLYTFLAFFLYDALDTPSACGSWIKRSLAIKPFIAFCVVFCFAFTTQIQVVLLFFTVLVYGAIRFLFRTFVQKKYLFTDIWAVFFYGFLCLGLLLGPLAHTLMYPITSRFLPSNHANLIIPRWEYNWAILKTDKWDHSLNHYLNVITGDFSYLYFLAIPGFALCFWVTRLRHATWLLCLFFTPFLLMSFVLRDPNLGKYMSFYYPTFIIAAATTIYWLIGPGFDRLKAVDMSDAARGIVMFIDRRRAVFSICFVVLVFVATVRFSAIYTLVTTKDYGNTVNTNLCEVYWVPWKEACLYLIDNKQPGDIVVQTEPSGLPWYYSKYAAGTPTFLLRESILNPATRTFVPIDTPKDGRDNAFSLQGLKRLFHKYKRGWVVGNYYLDNGIFVTEQTRRFITEHMQYHFNQNTTGLVRIFSWDHDNPVPNNPERYLFEEMGKPFGNRSSEVYNVDVPADAMKTAKQVKISLLCQGIDTDQEAVMRINKKNVFVPVKRKQIQVNGVVLNVPERKVRPVEFTLPISYFHHGNNSVQFSHSPQGDEGKNGYVVYAISLVPKKD